MTFEESARDIVPDVIDILRRFSHHVTEDPSREPDVFGSSTRDKLRSFISQAKPIILVLPAFPWKNRNLDKVIGRHPDLGEELGLARLNHVCEEIRKVYVHGALLHLIADGPVYNDLLGIPDAEYYEYGLQLRALAGKKGFGSIQFRRLPDLLQDGNSGELSRDDYLSSVPSWRARLEADFLDVNFDVDQEVLKNEDTRLTYQGYVRLAEEDLKWGVQFEGKNVAHTEAYTAAAHDVAKGMIRRLIAYEALISKKYETAIRLSIHPSTGKSKVSIPLLPQDGKSRGTPWHSSVAVLADGRILTGLSKEFREVYDLVVQDGVPYFFREKTDLFKLDAEVDIGYEYEGLVLAGNPTATPQLTESDKEKLAELIIRFRKVRTLGFKSAQHE